MKKNRPFFIFYLLFLLSLSSSIMGQRKMEIMDRGIVAMPKSSNQMYISWRHFATDPDDIAYNVYYKTTPVSASTKLNSEPISNSTNYTANLSTSSSLYIFEVKSVINGVEKDEPGSFTVPRQTPTSRIVRDFNFEPLPAGHPTMTMKFCWPADLDGDGKYDFVLDRQNYGEGSDDEESESGATDYSSPKVEAYTSEGVFLWRIDLGYNIKICTGHSDMVTAYDMNGDGKAEVLVAVSEGTVFADGKVVTGANGKVNDYSKSAGSAPQWISVLDGMTGIELDRMELPLYDQMLTTRSDKWKDISGHFIIAYLDGINPSLIYQYKNRLANNDFQGAHSAFRFINGKLELQWANLFYPGQAEFHQVRVGDVNGDGCDEFVEGGYVLAHDGSLLNRHEGVVHGDRHCLADIDPDRPGLEHFFIQQNNPNTLGMGLVDVATGKMIKGMYQEAVYDVGRGICAAFDPTRRGLQFFSTMDGNNMYDSKAKLISGAKGTFPAEALWWGSGLSRWELNPIGSTGANIAFHKYNTSTKSFDRDLPNLYNENNGNGTYYFSAAHGGRAAFWGDILGDWREEILCARSNGSGFVILSTWEETSIRQYTLMQNPAYRGQTTARGYYQTPDVDFYMAADMPAPPVAPVQKADLYYSGTSWIDNNDASATYADGKSIMFDIRGESGVYTLNNNMSPSRLWLMNPKGKNYVFSGTGKFTGNMDVVKSMQGDVTFNGNYDYTGITRVSEGRLFVNGTLASRVQLDARGVIGGNGTLNGGIVAETGLNVEGGRIEPGVGATLGVLTVVGNLDLPGRNNLAFDVDQTQGAKSDLLKIEGDFVLSGANYAIVINPLTPMVAGELILLTYTGTSNATLTDFKIIGLEGIPYVLKVEDKSIKLEIYEPRTAGSVVWKGAQSTLWDFQTQNFLNGTEDDIFVPGDAVTFNDDAVNKTIVIEETMPVSAMVFNNDTDYKISGDGAISGTGGIKKTGTGKLSLLNEDNSFTGGIEIDGGILEVISLKEGGLTSSIGASSGEASNWIMKNATLQTADQMFTDRSMRVEGKLTVNNPTTNNSIVIKGNVEGTDIALELIGKGTLTLQGSNSFKDVVVKDGLLLLGSENGNKNSLGTAKVTLEGGIFRMHDMNTTSQTGPFSNEVYVPEGVSARWDLPSRWRFDNKLTGSGTIQINVPYVRSDLNGNWSEFAGVIKFIGKDIRLNSANARLLKNAEVNLGSGTTLYVASNGSGGVSTANTITFGALSGSGSISGINYLVVGERGTNSTFSGTITSGAGRLNKKGSGNLTLSGNNAYTGTTTVEAGKLIVANTTGSATGTGTVNVSSTATLMGTGIMSSTVYINSGAVIMPGLSETSIGTLTIDKSLVMRDNSKVVMKVNNSRNDKIKASLITLNGVLEMVGLSGNTYSAGKSYTLFESSTGAVNGSFTSIEPASPGEGLEWDLSNLNKGIVSIKASSGIDQSTTSSSSVYPTVVENICTVSFDDNIDGAKVELVNSLGAVLHVKEISNSASVYEIDMSGFSTGFYFVKVIENGRLAIHKIIKK